MLIQRVMGHYLWRDDPIRCECCGAVLQDVPTKGLTEELGEAQVLWVKEQITYHGIIHIHHMEALLSNGMRYDLGLKGKQVGNTPGVRDEQTGRKFVDGSTRIAVPSSEEHQ